MRIISIPKMYSRRSRNCSCTQCRMQACFSARFVYVRDPLYALPVVSSGTWNRFVCVCVLPLLATTTGACVKSKLANALAAPDVAAS